MWRRWFLPVLLALSVGANVLLLHGLETAFGTIHFGRVFPLGYAADDRAAPARTNAPWIAFWGDSRALAWARSAAIPSADTLNAAHGGQTSSQLLLQLRTVPTPRADVAIVQIGVNDLHPLGALEPHRELVLKRLRDNLVDIRELLRGRGETVVLTTVIPPAAVPLARRRAWDPQTEQFLLEVNEQIRRLSDGRQVLLLDAYALLVGPDGKIQKRFEDPDFFLHVNAEAYRVLNEKLLELVPRRRS